MRGDLAILEAGFAALEQAVLVHDREGQVVACNRAAAKLAGRPIDEILGKGAGGYAQTLRYKDGTLLTRENSLLLRCIRTGEPVRDVLVEIREADGSRPRWISASYQPLIHEGEEEPWGAVSSIVPVPAQEAPYEALQDFSVQVRHVLEQDGALLFMKDREGRFRFMNRGLAQLLGVRRDEAIGKTVHELLPPETAGLIHESDRRALESRGTIEVEERFEQGGEAHVVRTIKFALLGAEGEPYAVAGISADVTELDRARREREAQLECAPVGLLGVDREGRVSFANREARAIAVRCDDLQFLIDGGVTLADFLDGDDVTVRTAIDRGHPLSLTKSFEHPDGDEMWLCFDVTAIDGGAGAVCSVRDVTEERELQQELSHQAFHDPLTGLPNRRFTEEQLALGLARARRQAGGVGVVFVDIDEFKRVNDDLGHAAGDQVLVEFSERLTGALRETDAIGRVADPGPVVTRRGGDEFVLVLTDLPPDCAELVAGVMRRVGEALEKPFAVAGSRLEISASVGAAAYPYDSQDPRALLELANSAMRAAKRRRQGVRKTEPQDTG